MLGHCLKLFVVQTVTKAQFSFTMTLSHYDYFVDFDFEVVTVVALAYFSSVRPQAQASCISPYAPHMARSLRSDSKLVIMSKSCTVRSVQDCCCGQSNKKTTLLCTCDVLHLSGSASWVYF